MARRAPRTAFSLVELLVVLAIVGLLVALMLPALAGTRHASRRTQCMNNLRQLALAGHNYLDAHGVFPPGYVSIDGDRGPGWGWATQMLPQMEQGPVFRTITFERPIAAAENRTARVVSFRTVLCPSEPPAGPPQVVDAAGRVLLDDATPAHYVASAGPYDPGGGTAGMFWRNSALTPDGVTDGLSFTLMFGERSRRQGDVLWAGVVPEAVPGTGARWPTRERGPARALALGQTGTDGPAGFSSSHEGGRQFAMGDGSVRFLADRVAPGVLHALSTRAGGEMIQAEEY